MRNWKRKEEKWNMNQKEQKRKQGEDKKYLKIFRMSMNKYQKKTVNWWRKWLGCNFRQGH